MTSYERQYRRYDRCLANLLYAALTIGILALAVLLCSCGTNQPLGTQIAPVVRSNTASFDGNDQNSGVLGYDGSFHVTAHFRDRYVTMAKTYGWRFVPALDTARGVTARPDGTWSFDAEAMQDFLRMNNWRRNAISTPPTLMQKITEHL